MTNEERAREWLYGAKSESAYISETMIADLANLLREVRLDEAEWWHRNNDDDKCVRRIATLREGRKP